MPLMTSINRVARLVRRELRGGLRGFGVFLTCLFLGTFAILATLSLFQMVVNRFSRGRDVQKYRIASTKAGLRFEDLDRLFAESKLKVISRSCYQDQDEYVFVMRATGSRDTHLALREKLLGMEEYRLRRS